VIDRVSAEAGAPARVVKGTIIESQPSGSRGRWITAAVLGAVAVALAVVIVFPLSHARHHRHRLQSQVGLSTVEQAAVTAADQQVLNMLTYRRKTFDADYARTVAGASGPLASDLNKSSNKTALLQKMTQGKFDLQGQITASAFEESSGTTYNVLVSASGYQVPDGGQRTLSSTARFEVTMTRAGTKWLASNLQSVGLI
jgi:hypothetical protein